MDEMKEIVTIEQANGLFLILAIAAPVLGALIGLALGARKRSAARGALTGFLVGLLGPANFLLWKVYNAITDRLGLDTVKNLLVNLALFAALGVIAGLIAGRYYRRQEITQPEPSDSEQNPSEPVI